jgi:hypothetical protein
MCVRFITDATEIHARWTVKRRAARFHHDGDRRRLRLSAGQRTMALDRRRTSG